ncbi:MAG: OsmC family peroxiredoxin [Vicinamibacterales bacterium]
MPSFERHADVTWTGSLKDGNGEAKAGTGAFSLPVSFPARVEQPGGKTSPEELIAAAHAACYAMALSATLGRKNASAARLRVRATIRAAFEAGIRIQSSHLEVTAEGLQGIDAADFPAVAREAEGACPVSNALRGSLTITVDARVA